MEYPSIVVAEPTTQKCTTPLDHEIASLKNFAAQLKQHSIRIQELLHGIDGPLARPHKKSARVSLVENMDLLISINSKLKDVKRLLDLYDNRNEIICELLPKLLFFGKIVGNLESALAKDGSGIDENGVDKFFNLSTWIFDKIKAM